jgi:hypothetical protein
VKLSKFKHTTPTPPREYQSAGSLASVSVSKRAELDTAMSAVYDEPQKGKPGFSSRNLALFAIIGGIVASMLTAGVIYLLSEESLTSPPWQPDKMAAIENQIVVREPPTGISKENKSSAKEENHNTGTKNGDDASGASELIEIPVTLRPAETELLLNGNVIEVKANSIRIPGDGQSYAIVARAPDYVTETYTIVAKMGETLLVELSRSRPLRSNHSKKARKTERRKTRRNRAGKKTNTILKGNPY